MLASARRALCLLLLGAFARAQEIRPDPTGDASILPGIGPVPGGVGLQPLKIQFSIAPLGLAAASEFQAPPAASSSRPTAAVAPAAGTAGIRHAILLKESAAASEIGAPRAGAPAVPPNGAAPAGVAPQARGGPTAMPAAAESGGRSAEDLSAEAGARFDLQAAAPRPAFAPWTAAAETAASAVPAAPSVWKRVAALLERPDSIPAWPAKPGDKVRLGGRTFVVGEKLGEGTASVVHKVRDADQVIKFIHPGSKDAPIFGAEADALEALSRTEIPHARLRARSADGLVLVKEYLEGETLAKSLVSGPLREHQTEALADLAARLLRIGTSADLNRSNLVWDHWAQAWKLMDAGGFRRANPWGPLGQIHGNILDGGGIDRVQFLSAVRGRLGPDSGAWRSVIAAGENEAALKKWLEELSLRDAERPPPPRIVFEGAAQDAVLGDEIVSLGTLRRRLGYDPRSVKRRRGLKRDKGKLNTEVEEIEPEGRPTRVLKRSGFGIIQAEAAARRIGRRFFARYFDFPRSLGYEAGYDSGLVMELSRGTPSHAREMLDLEHRVALGLFIHTLGISDVNRDNVLYHEGRATLIDFEFAFSPIHPSARIPDESILWEMPWMSGETPNRIEDYLPAVAAWRELFLKPETQSQLEDDLRRCGYKPREAARIMSVLRNNALQLEWVLQMDAEFANYFVARRRA